MASDGAAPCDGYDVVKERVVKGPVDDVNARLDALAAADSGVAVALSFARGELTLEEAKARTVGALTVNNFWCYMPMHQYIFTESRELWPGSSVDSRVPLVMEDGKPIKASVYIATKRAVDQMTWAPGRPEVIDDYLIAGGGWIARPGCRVFNLYIPPSISPGRPELADRWIDHVYRIYPEHADHIIRFLAHRVQRPGEKINHALLLGGKQGIGKDTLLEPVKYAVGPHNVAEVAPTHLLNRFNGYVKSVILRVSEARDQGDIDRYALYDHMKTLTAAPPDVLRCDEKNIREYAVVNVCGVIVTTNHKSDGIYLPADDRRHYVAWSECDRSEFEPDYWRALYAWFGSGGNAHVAAYLSAFDLSGFDPKAPPPKTAAFWDIVDANRAPEDAELADILDAIDNPAAITLTRLVDRAAGAFQEWLKDRRNRRQIPHRLEAAGYTPIRNSAAADGLWKVAGKRQAIYARTELSLRDRIAAAGELTR